MTPQDDNNHENQIDTVDEFYDDPGQGEFYDNLPPENEPTGSLKDRLVDQWQNNPAFKMIIIVVGGFLLIGSAFALLGNKEDGGGQTKVQRASDIKGVAGGEVSPAIRQAIDERNQQLADEAAKSGGSAIPIPVGEGQVIPPPPADVLDPLKQWELQGNQAGQSVPAPQQQPQDLSPLMDAMKAQMEAIMGSWAPKSATVVTFPADASGYPQQGQQNGSIQPASAVPAAKVIVSSGTIFYSMLVTEANSDIPGVPILAEVVQGPLKGARLIGQFQTLDDYLVLHFNSMSYQTQDWPVNAIALDPNTTLAGVATETDQRYFKRLVLPAAARFVSSFGSALADVGTQTTITGDTVIQSRPGLNSREALYKGLGDSADMVSNFMTAEGAKTQPLVRVASGTALGIFFVSSVKEGQGQ